MRRLRVYWARRSGKEQAIEASMALLPQFICRLPPELKRSKPRESKGKKGSGIRRSPHAPRLCESKVNTAADEALLWRQRSELRIFEVGFQNGSFSALLETTPSINALNHLRCFAAPELQQQEYHPPVANSTCQTRVLYNSGSLILSGAC